MSSPAAADAAVLDASSSPSLVHRLRSSSEQVLTNSREKLLTMVEDDTKRVVRFQEFFGVRLKDESLASAEGGSEMHADEEWLGAHRSSFHTATYTKAPLILDLLFRFGAGLGNELFYILFLPNFIWTVNWRLGRELCAMWVAMYYVGQLLKDLLKLPRPPSPPVVRLETHYSMEYGLPSTHAMAAASLPFFIAYRLTPSSAEWLPVDAASALDFGSMIHSSLFLAVLALWGIAFAWWVLMTTSRLYMGVHSVVDLVAGMALGFASLAFFLAYGKGIDEWLVTSPHGGWITVVGSVTMVLAYYVITRPPRWTPCYGDTALIVAVGMGVVLAARMVYGDTSELYYGELLPSALLPSIVAHSSASGALRGDWAMIWVVRSLVAYAMLMIARMISKFTVSTLLEMLLPASSQPKKERYEIEIPTKMVTYSIVGFVTVGVVPPMFQYYGWWYPV